MRLDGSIKSLAASQHSCVATWQLRELGASSKEITRLRRSKGWDEMARGVLCLVGAPASERQTACAAVLEGGPDAALARESSAALYGVGASYRLLPADVMLRHGHAGHSESIGHARPLTGIGDRWITRVDGIRVVRPEL